MNQHNKNNKVQDKLLQTNKGYLRYLEGKVKHCHQQWEELSDFELEVVTGAGGDGEGPGDMDD